LHLRQSLFSKFNESISPTAASPALVQTVC
jgi:hypothetical protein